MMTRRLLDPATGFEELSIDAVADETEQPNNKRLKRV